MTRKLTIETILKSKEENLYYRPVAIDVNNNIIVLAKLFMSYEEFVEDKSNIPCLCYDSLAAYVMDELNNYFTW